MKVNNEKKAMLKVKDKIDKLKIILEIEKYRKEFNKKQNHYYYINKYILKNGKRNKFNKRLQEDELPSNYETNEFWSNIYSCNKEVNINNELININNDEMEIEENELEITKEEIITAIKRIPNWKSPGPDGIQGYYIKYNDRVGKEIINLITEWFYDEYINYEYCNAKTVLLYKGGDSKDPKNYRPISCANVIYKIYTSILHKKLYEELNKNKIKLNKSQYGCKKNVMTAKEALMTNNKVQMMLKKN